MGFHSWATAARRAYEVAPQRPGNPDNHRTHAGPITLAPSLRKAAGRHMGLTT